MAKYIYQNLNWTAFSWDEKLITPLLSEVRHLQGLIIGNMRALGFTAQSEANLVTLTLDVLKSSEIEGEKLDYDQVRSSIAKRLGMDYDGIIPINRDVEGVVEMMLDAIQHFEKKLTQERLLDWHASLFPTGRSGMYKIEVGKYRTGEMQIVSGAMGRESVHYEAPKAALVPEEMQQFLDWFNADNILDMVLKAAVAHFWFIIIHPFDDGNGRIARALSDMLLARSDNSSLRFYSMSNQILLERKKYYEVLQKVQHHDYDITEWIIWFLNCLKNALQQTETALQKTLQKVHFWEKHQSVTFNERQRYMLNKLLTDFEGKLQTSKWAKMTKCSSDTALRDIKDLLEKGILHPQEGGGRNVSYVLLMNCM